MNRPSTDYWSLPHFIAASAAFTPSELLETVGAKSAAHREDSYIPPLLRGEGQGGGAVDLQRSINDLRQNNLSQLLVRFQKNFDFIVKARNRRWADLPVRQNSGLAVLRQP